MTETMNGADARTKYRLYRYFDDEQVPLYVGRSAHLATREQVHIDTSKWMDFAAGSTIERYETPEDLADAERIAIKAEKPIFNKQHNDTPEAKERLRAYLDRHGRLDLLEPGPRMIRQTPRTVIAGTPPQALDPEGDEKRRAYLAGEPVELYPGGPVRTRRTATNGHLFYGP